LKIVLVGYMGSGKSTIGLALADVLKLEFLDLDSYIETQEGLSIPEIFLKHGELYFRKKEGAYLKEILTTKTNFVLATGGGTPCYGINMKEILEATANVFYLKLSLSSLVMRLKSEKEHRPLIKNVADEELTEFIGKHLFERSYYYNQAEKAILCDNQLPAEIVKMLASQLV